MDNRYPSFLWYESLNSSHKNNANGKKRNAKTIAIYNGLRNFADSLFCYKPNILYKIYNLSYYHSNNTPFIKYSFLFVFLSQALHYLQQILTFGPYQM